MNHMTLFAPSVRRLLADPFFAPLEFAPAFGRSPSRPTRTPPVDVRDSASELRLEMELPGIPREDISVRFHDGRLTIEGKSGDAARNPEAAPGDATAADVEVRTQTPAWRRRERFHGVFRRAFTLPDTVDVSRIEAGTSNGVLTVVLPKLEQAQPREIEVQVH